MNLGELKDESSYLGVPNSPISLGGGESSRTNRVFVVTSFTQKTPAFT